MQYNYMMDSKRLCFQKLRVGAPTPSRNRVDDAGFDLAYFDRETEDGKLPELSVDPFCTIKVPTGIACACDKHIYLRVAERSGFSSRNGLIVLGGVVDASYRGEIFVLLHNVSNNICRISQGDRVAQLIPTLIFQTDMLQMVEVNQLDETDRGSQGFGSSDKV
jgi:dUTP pyrophosphatase